MRSSLQWPYRALCLSLLTSSAVFSAQIASAKEFVINEPATLLPPTLPWHGASEALVNNDPKWQTPAERNDFVNTPSYGETIDYLEKLAEKSDLIKLSYFGKSTLGKPLMLVHVSSDFNAKSRPKVLAQAGIHSGEIDGKDAGLMLVRDIVLGKQANLVEDVDLLFVPIFNADGHENKSKYHRVNQRGPSNMGWRATSQNLNLNRDYAKIKSVEMAAMIKLLNKYQPSLYLDLHVTDGVDYQYDITYGTIKSHSYSPEIAKWFDNFYRPTVDTALSTMGHIPGDLVFAMDNRNIEKGIAGWSPGQRYSDGYGATRHIPTVLVENHSLKPYKQRVLGTYVLIESSLKAVAAHQKHLSKAIASDKSSRPDELPLTWGYNKPRTVAFKGITYQHFDDEISGTQQVKWTGKAKTYQMPWFDRNVPKLVTKLPKSYWILPQYTNAISRLKQHSIKTNTLTAPRTIMLESLSVANSEFAKAPYEGEMRVKATFNSHKSDIELPAGSVEVSLDQPLGKLAFALLEPQSPDSLFHWGFFNTIFQRTEYIEGYAVVPMAQQMLAQSPALKKAFEEKLKTDKEFADNPRARLAWIYRQSPFYDKAHGRYPVYRQW
ncbi:MAG: M14 family metallopeptidase [Psychrobium sp.]